MDTREITLTVSLEIELNSPSNKSCATCLTRRSVQPPRHVVIYKNALIDFAQPSDVVCDFTDSAWKLWDVIVGVENESWAYEGLMLIAICHGQVCQRTRDG